MTDFEDISFLRKHLKFWRNIHQIFVQERIMAEENIHGQLMDELKDENNVEKLKVQTLLKQIVHNIELAYHKTY